MTSAMMKKMTEIDETEADSCVTCIDRWLLLSATPSLFVFNFDDDDQDDEDEKIMRGGCKKDKIIWFIWPQDVICFLRSMANSFQIKLKMKMIIWIDRWFLSGPPCVFNCVALTHDPQGQPLEEQHLSMESIWWGTSGFATFAGELFFIAGQALTWSQNIKWNMTHHSPAQAGQHFVNNLVFCHRHQLFDSTRGHLGKLLWDKLLPLLPLLNCTIAYDPGQEGNYWFLLQVCDKLLTTIKLDPACMMFGFSGRRDTHPGFPVQ